MSITWTETKNSRAFSFDPPSFNLEYRATGETDDNIVTSYAFGVLPLTVYTQVGTLYLQDVRIAPDGWGRHIVTAPYGPKKKETGSYTWNFDTTGATIKIKAGKSHINSYYASGESGPADKHRGAIGVKPDLDVEGCDIVVPAMKLSVQFRHPQGIVTLAYAKALAGITGRFNSVAFLGFDIGELLYVGSTGGDGSETDAEVAYQFVASQNATGLTIGGISGIAKAGHDYAWVEFMDKPNSGKPAVMARVVHIERVYDGVSFASIFGWG